MITDYASLKQAVADWLARADLTAQIPTFIRLAEARMNKDLRTYEMQAETTGTVTVSTNSIPITEDILELQSVRVVFQGYAKEVYPLPPERMADRDVQTAYPLGYVRVGDLLYLIGGTISDDTPPEQAYTYSLLYFASIPLLNSEASPPVTSNWALLKEPGLYLYGALIEASPYLQDDQRALVWAEQYKSILTAMRVSDDNARCGNAPSLRIRGMCP